MSPPRLADAADHGWTALVLLTELEDRRLLVARVWAVTHRGMPGEATDEVLRPGMRSLIHHGRTHLIVPVEESYDFTGGQAYMTDLLRGRFGDALAVHFL